MRKKKIGVFIGNTHTFFPRQLMKSIYENSKREDYDLHFYLGLEYAQFMGDDVSSSSDMDYQYSTIYDYAFFSSLDVVIIAYGTITTFHRIAMEDFYEKLNGIPCVVLSDKVDPEKGVSIRTDNYKGIYDCTEHLIKEHGLKRILHLAGPYDINTDAKERLEGYRAALADNGLGFSYRMIAKGDYTEYDDEIVGKLLDDNPDAEAVVSANDEMTTAVYRVCEERGLAVGVDLAVTGFDNIFASAYVEPPLTTNRQNAFEMGKTAVQQAENMIEGRKAEDVLVPVDFIVRCSCGCPSKAVPEAPKDDEDFMNQYNTVKESYHRSLTGPYLIKELITLAEDKHRFYERVCEILCAHGAVTSKIYELPKVCVINNAEDWKMPELLYLTAFQEGNNINVLDVPIEFTRQSSEWMSDFFSEDRHRSFFNFLLFDGKRNYGVLECEISPEKLTDFYMISVQLGTAMHFLEISLERAEFRKKLEEQNSLLNFNAYTDALTGVLNRRGIYDKTVSCLNGHESDHMIIFMVDLDHLKEINDNFGHAEGDNAIKVTATILKNLIGNRGYVGRYGGDEFLAIMAVRESDDKQEWIERIEGAIRKKAEKYNSNSKRPYYVEMSVGGVEVSADSGMDFSQLIAKVDGLLYEAKKNRRSTVIRV
ncbi:MAG: GGDEF domain-containing protein [Lachnospiraceae bacterium]|nr:GGDEF domain-containing protein [Lachnospiraceae bacterium]